MIQPTIKKTFLIVKCSGSSLSFFKVFAQELTKDSESQDSLLSPVRLSLEQQQILTDNSVNEKLSHNLILD